MGDTLVSVQRCEPFLDVLFAQIAEQAVSELRHMPRETPVEHRRL